VELVELEHVLELVELEHVLEELAVLPGFEFQKEVRCSDASSSTFFFFCF